MFYIAHLIFLVTGAQYIFENVAFEKTAKQNSDSSDLTPASKAVDGDLLQDAKTRAQPGVRQWWMVNLERLHTLIRIAVYSKYSCL